MKNTFTTVLLLFWLFAAPLIQAEETSFIFQPAPQKNITDKNTLNWQGLPPTAVVQTVLENLPQVLGAKAGVTGGEARRDQLRAGDYEWTLGYAAQRRRNRPIDAAGKNFREWNVNMERPIRLPGKGKTDAAMGEKYLEIAETNYGDAEHEASRALLSAWFMWQKEKTALAAWESQVAVLDRGRAAVSRRLALGDAARLEKMQSEVALVQAKIQRDQAKTRAYAAEQLLRETFPGLLNPVTENINPLTALTLPTLEGSEAEWLEEYTTHQHEWLLAKQQAELAELNAARARQNRLSDPTVGIQYANETGGEDKILGVFIKIPLPGSARFAGSRLAESEALAAKQQALLVAQKIRAQARSLYYAAQNAPAIWQAASDEIKDTQASAKLVERAYYLGEGTLNELLNTLRLSHESLLQNRTLQLEAMEQYYRLRLDTHRLWEDKDETHDN